MEVEFNFSYFFSVLTDSMPCTSPKGFPPCPCVIVSTLSSRQHHMALAVLHYWCFPLPQSMYAQQNCAGVASCLVNLFPELRKKNMASRGLCFKVDKFGFQRWHIWGREVVWNYQKSVAESSVRFPGAALKWCSSNRDFSCVRLWTHS